MKTILKNSHGFTLIEIIVTLMLVGVLAAAAGFGMEFIAKGYVAARENARMAQTAQIALLRMSRELMALESINTAARTEIVITKANNDKVAIEFDGEQIKLDNDNDASDGNILIDHVTSFQLKYSYFDNGLLERIDIELKLKPDYLENPIDPFKISINPRNNDTKNAPYKLAS